MTFLIYLLVGFITAMCGLPIVKDGHFSLKNFMLLTLILIVVSLILKAKSR